MSVLDTGQPLLIVMEASVAPKQKWRWQMKQHLSGLASPGTPHFLREFIDAQPQANLFLSAFVPFVFLLLWLIPICLRQFVCYLRFYPAADLIEQKRNVVILNVQVEPGQSKPNLGLSCAANLERNSSWSPCGCCTTVLLNRQLLKTEWVNLSLTSTEQFIHSCNINCFVNVCFFFTVSHLLLPLMQICSVSAR